MKKLKEKFCKECGKKLWRYNTSGFCIDCFDFSNNTKELWKQKEYRKIVLEKSSKPRSKNFKKEQSKRIKNWFKNNPNQKLLRSQSMKKSWREGKIPHHGLGINKSRGEKELLKDLKEIFPFVQEGFCLKIEDSWFFPDIFFKEDNLIIEYFGDYWHANPDIYENNEIVHSGKTAKEIQVQDQMRIQKFEKNGYFVEIVFQSDYNKNRELVLDRIISILNWESCCV